jgi:hypothetical protein
LNITFPFNIDWLEKKKTTNSTKSWIFGNYPVAMFDRPQQVPNDAYEGQVRAEASMYRIMMDRFVYKDEVLAFQRNHSFDRHTVIGLHLRHGNGETGDFANKGREMKVPEEVWLANFASMIFNYTRTDSRFQSKPPLVFLATDGPSRLKDILESDLNHEIPVVTVPQPRVAEGEGVSYNKGGEDCVSSWAAQLKDQILLGQSDMVVAGTYSSFSHTLPASMQFDKVRRIENREKAWRDHNSNVTPNSTDNKQRHGVFCEVGGDGSKMQCFDDYLEWVLRRSTIPLVGNPKGMDHAFRYTGKFIDRENMQSFLDKAENHNLVGEKGRWFHHMSS